MIRLNATLYLASKSPRRLKLLKQIGFKPKVVELNYNEKIGQDEQPHQAAKRIAEEKMDLAKKKIKNGIILTADTVVLLKDEIIGKPANEKEAIETLKKLSGKTHTVFTGYCVHNTKYDDFISDFTKSFVSFRDLSDEEIEKYVASGSPLDKAGAYGIQDDYGSVFVRRINGCYNNVVGLPLADVFDALMKIK